MTGTKPTLLDDPSVQEIVRDLEGALAEGNQLAARFSALIEPILTDEDTPAPLALAAAMHFLSGLAAVGCEPGRQKHLRVAMLTVLHDLLRAHMDRRALIDAAPAGSA